MNTKLLGCTLLIVGTAIGGGMLALPIATSEADFLFIHPVARLLVGNDCECIFDFRSESLVATHSNIISMAKATLG